ncbi:hypothetical protein ACO2Q7_02445 [Rathayibacter sp. KR2-224]|uniref:hypothetical protein n=1 Tax=Rathayibacter sp. KR2-224 TaxID=3400913 RepID=UPI003C0C8FEF
MTSWPDQPPQTRRQAREHQRAAEREQGATPPQQQVPVSRRAATIAPTTAGEVPDVATPYSFASAQRGAAAQKSSAQQTAVQEADEQQSASEKRSVATDAPPARPRAPRYDDLSFDNLLAASHAGGPADAAAGGEGHGSNDSSAPDAQPGAGEQSDASGEAAAAQQMPPLPTVSPVDGHPLTRRELRAMLQAQAANQAAQPGSVSGGVTAVPVEGTGDSAEGASGETTHRVVPPATPLVSEEEEAKPQTPVTAVSAPAAARAASPTTPVSPLVIPEAFPDAGAQAATTESDSHDAGTDPAANPQLTARAAGHWSNMDEENATGETSRSAVSTGSVTTTNALILPSIPSAGLTTSPLTSTGEVIVTGSIDLPKSFGATGQHPDHFDSSDIDRLFEESDASPATSAVAPVRASKAIATHTSTRGMITPPRARGNKLPVILAATAAVLAAGVGALLAAGFYFHAF